MNGAKIHLARHGQTYFNLEEILGGDSELTPEGWEHAKKVARSFAGIPLDIIYSSKSIRSIQTAGVLHKRYPGIPLIKIEELHEISYGDLDSMKNSDFEMQHPDLFEARQTDKYNWCPQNGENYELGLERVMPFLDEIKSQGKNSAIVGHQGMNRIILGYLLDLPEAEIPHLVIPNDVFFIINTDDKKVSHIRDGEMVEGYVV